MKDFITKPIILTHSTIPKPLHGLNPREIFGQEWWNNTRQKAYAKYNYHCIACGVHKSEAKKHKWLEAHEFYKIDYANGLMEIESIEPLCHYCHNFIHSGRLRMIENKEKTTKEIIDILEHGLEILSDNKLPVFCGTFNYAIELGCETFFAKREIEYTGKIANWEKWRLKIDNKEYKVKFNSLEEWKSYYKIKN